MTLLRCERGSVWVVAAVFVPVIILFGTFIVDVGNWFTHKRHLQTQADAAALAAGTRFALPCTKNAADPFDPATVNGQIARTALNYSGPSLTNPQTSLPTDPVFPFNPQVSPTQQGNLHTLLNAKDFFGQGDNTQFGTTWGFSCDTGFLDVKMTENNLPWFFHLVGSGLGVVPKINAQARVRFSESTGERGFLPLGLPAPQIAKVTATIRGCSNQVLATVPLVKSSTQNIAGLTLWVAPTGTFSLTKPASSNQCVGDHSTLNTNIEISGNSAVDPTLVGTGTTPPNCGTKFVDCYESTEGRIWRVAASPGPPQGEQDAPVFRDVNLGPGCAPGSPYWATGIRSNLPCQFGLSAYVDWGALPGLAGHSGFHEKLTAIGGGGSSPFGTDTCKTSGVCAGGSGITSGDGTSGTQPNGAPGYQSVRIAWEYWWDSGPPGYHCKPNAHCSDTSPILARANSDDQGLLAKVVVTDEDPSTGAYYGLPLDSVPYDSFPGTASIVVGTADGYQLGQRAVLRLGASQGNQSLVCDPDYTQGKTYQMIRDGCKPLYGINNLDGTVDQPPRTPSISWEPCPDPGTSLGSDPGKFFVYPQSGAWYCIPTEPGKRPSQVADGIATRTGNCGNPNPNGCGGHPTCVHPNNWVAGKSYDPNLAPSDPNYDPRVIKIYLIPVGALNKSNGNDVVEVIGFAGFYVTGWGGNGANADPCTNQGLNPEDIPSGNGTIAGRFVKLVDPPNAVPNPTQSCDPNNILPCTVVLVR